MIIRPGRSARSALDAGMDEILTKIHIQPLEALGKDDIFVLGEKWV